MNIHQSLNDFNRRMAEEVRGTFASNVMPFQSEDGTLLFRGPILNHQDPSHIGTHVAVSLEKDVYVALDTASDAEREEMMENLLAALSTQVKIRYNPKNIGPYAMDIVGTMRTIRGK